MLTPGHDVTLTETNRRAWLPICACGWYGTAHDGTWTADIDVNADQYQKVTSRAAALAEHEAHVRAVAPGTVDDPAVAAERHEAYVAAVKRTLHRPGRWSTA